jgi:hypothetical protein
LTPQFSFEKFTVLTVSKLGSKLNFFWSTLNSTLSSNLSSNLSSKLRPNFELNFELEVEFKVGSRMGQFSRASQTLPSDNKKVHSDNDTQQRQHTNNTGNEQQLCDNAIRCYDTKYTDPSSHGLSSFLVLGHDKKAIQTACQTTEQVV